MNSLEKNILKVNKIGDRSKSSIENRFHRGEMKGQKGREEVERQEKHLSSSFSKLLREKAKLQRRENGLTL